MNTNEANNVAYEIAQMAAAVEEGNANALEAYVNAAKLKKVCEAVMAQVKDEAIGEAQKYGKEAEVYGVKVQVRNAPPQYSFKDDPVFCNFDNLAKQRKQMLTKAAKSNFTLTDENGEEIPKVSYTEGATTIAVTIK
jgi:hypothetical protein